MLIGGHSFRSNIIEVSLMNHVVEIRCCVQQSLLASKAIVHAIDTISLALNRLVNCVLSQLFISFY